MKRMIAALTLALTLALAVAPAGAEEDAESVTGEFYTMPADPEAGLAPVLFFTLTGHAAKALYEALAVSAEDNECTGGKTKYLADHSGYCDLDAVQGEYFCSFSIDLETARFAGGETC
jgi:hypothetical protein